MMPMAGCCIAICYAGGGRDVEAEARNGPTLLAHEREMNAERGSFSHGGFHANAASLPHGLVHDGEDEGESLHGGMLRHGVGACKFIP